MYIRDALLLDSFLLYRIHHCLPCTYSQSIAPVHLMLRITTNAPSQLGVITSSLLQPLHLIPYSAPVLTTVSSQ